MELATRFRSQALSLISAALTIAAFASCSDSGGGSTKTDPLPHAVSFSNLHDGGLVNTGFVVGTVDTSGAGIDGVEVAVDDGEYEAATGTTEWRFALPSGGGTWPELTAHTISARGTLDGAVSEETTITVIKGTNKDVNGDGYADVIIGENGYNSNFGRAYVFLSNGPEGVVVSAAADADTIITGTSTGDQFGSMVASGDVNGDGYADLIVGARSYNSNAGRLYVFHSAGTSGVAESAAVSADTIIDAEGTPSRMGFWMAAGDLNGDGYADVVTGSPEYGSGQGRAYVFHSSGANGVTATSAGSANTIITGENIGEQFGFRVATGDVNGDGFADLLVGAQGAGSGNGRAYVFHSSGGVGVSASTAASANSTITGGASGDTFSFGLGTGDINGDGYADVLVGANAYNGGDGRAYVFHSAGTNGVTIAAAGSASAILDGQAGSGFGNSVSAGDVDGDGDMDLLVGAPLYVSSTGRAYVFHSAGGGGVGNASAASANTIITGVGAECLAFSIGAADVNGDGYADLITGGYCGSDGRGYVVHSSGNVGISSANSNNADTFVTAPGTGRFGSCLGTGY